jgi:hypothetical protein
MWPNFGAVRSASKRLRTTHPQNVPSGSSNRHVLRRGSRHERRRRVSTRAGAGVGSLGAASQKRGGRSIRERALAIRVSNPVAPVPVERGAAARRGGPGGSTAESARSEAAAARRPGPTAGTGDAPSAKGEGAAARRMTASGGSSNGGAATTVAPRSSQRGAGRALAERASAHTASATLAAITKRSTRAAADTGATVDRGEPGSQAALGGFVNAGGPRSRRPSG